MIRCDGEKEEEMSKSGAMGSQKGWLHSTSRTDVTASQLRIAGQVKSATEDQQVGKRGGRQLKTEHAKTRAESGIEASKRG